MRPMRVPPTVSLPAGAGLLARWLRHAGVRARTDAEAQPVLATDGTRWGRARVQRGDAEEVVLLPEASWQDQLAALGPSLGWSLEDLAPLTRCPPCGGALAHDPGARPPPRALPQGEVAVLRCTDCARPTWAGPAVQAHRRTLRELWLSRLFRCARCGEAGPGSNLLRVEVLASPGPVEIPAEDLSRDPSAEIAALLGQIESMSEAALEDSVAYLRERPLCHPCKRTLLSTLRQFFQEETPA